MPTTTRRADTPVGSETAPAGAWARASAGAPATATETVPLDAELLRTLLDASPDIVSIIGPDGRWRFVAGAVERLLGVGLHELHGLDGVDLVHPDDHPALDACLRAVRVRAGAAGSAEHRLRRDDGGWRWVETAAVNRLDDPRVAGVVLTTRDLTRRKLAEEEVRQREAHHRALLEAMPDMHFRVTREGVYLEARAKRRADLLVAPDQIVGRRVADLMPPDVAGLILEAIRAALDEGEVRTVEYALPVGTAERHYEARVVAYAPDEVMAIVRDVSEREAARRSREDAEAKFAALLEHGSDMMVVHDLDGVRRFVSPAAARMMGRAAEDLVGTSAYDNLQPDVVAALRAATAACLRDAAARPTFTVHLPYPGVGWRTLEVVATNMLDVPGVEGILYTSRDVTERERAAAELRASQQLLAGAFDHTGVGMAITSVSGALRKVNQAFADLLGYGPEELVGRHVSELAHPDEAAQSRDFVRRMASAELDSVRVERRYVRRDGGEVVVLLTVTAVSDEHGLPLYHVAQIQDITERKRLEEQLRHLATHDPLTGLANRALLMQRLDAAMADREDEGTVGVLYLDLDGFKAVNDRLGHAAGDALLRAVAAAVAGQVRPVDVAARIGGDEFVVLVERDATAASLDELAGRLVDAVATAPGVLEIGLPVSVSVGVALSEAAQRATGLLREADAALYAAKDARRLKATTSGLRAR